MYAHKHIVHAYTCIIGYLHACNVQMYFKFMFAGMCFFCILNNYLSFSFVVHTFAYIYLYIRIFVLFVVLLGFYFITRILFT